MPAQPPPIVAYIPDLLMRQQVVEGLRAAGFPARGAATRARLDAAIAEGATAVVVELDGVGVDGPELVAELKTAPATAPLPVVGFCAHTRTDVIEGARAAGADRVVARGELVRRLASIAADVAGFAPHD